MKKPQESGASGGVPPEAPGADLGGAQGAAPPGARRARESEPWSVFGDGGGGWLFDVPLPDPFLTAVTLTTGSRCWGFGGSCCAVPRPGVELRLRDTAFWLGDVGIQARA